VYCLCVGYEFVLLIVCNVVIYVCIFVGKNLEESLSHMSSAVHVSEDEVFMFSEESENDEFFEDVDVMNDAGSSKGKGIDVTNEVFDVWARKDVHDGGESSKPGGFLCLVT
jgi:hypothetical protein